MVSLWAQSCEGDREWGFGAQYVTGNNILQHAMGHESQVHGSKSEETGKVHGLLGYY